MNKRYQMKNKKNKVKKKNSSKILDTDNRNIIRQYDGSLDLSHFHSKLISDGTLKLEYAPS